MLGSSPHRYALYEAQVRQEFEHVEERLFNAGRARILHAFLEQTSIYATRFFELRLEAEARANLSNALRRLSGGEP